MNIKKKIYLAKKGLSEKDIFLSEEYRDYLEKMSNNSIATLTEGRCSALEVIGDENENAPVAYTNGNRKVINTLNSLFRSLDRTNRHLGCVGLNAHEDGHILFTDFPICKDYEFSLRSGNLKKYCPNAKGNILNNLEELSQIAKQFENKFQYVVQYALQIQNILEDAFVNAMMIELFPGIYKAGISFCDQRTIKQHPTLSDMVQKNIPKEAIMGNLMIQYLKSGNIKEGEYKEGELLNLFYSLVPTIDRAAWSYNVYDRYAATTEIVALLYPYLKETMDKMQDKNQKNSSKSSSKSSSESSSESSSKSSSKSSSESSSESSSKSSSENGSKGSDLTASELEELVKKATKELIGTTKTPENRRTKSVSDVKEKKSNSNSSSLKKAVRENQTSPLEKEAGRINAESVATAPSASTGGVNKKKEYEEVKLNSILNKVAEKKINESKQKEVDEELKTSGKNKEFAGIHKHVPVNIVTNSCVTTDNKERYENIARTISPLVKKMEKSLKKYIEENEKTYVDRSFVGKKFNPKTLYKNDGKNFLKIGEGRKVVDLAIELLIDQSGSMAGQRIDAAMKMAVAVEKMCSELNIPLSVHGHTTTKEYASIKIYSYLEFNNMDKSRKYMLANLEAKSCNRDGAAIRFLADRLEKRQEKNKLLILISDGQPYDLGYSGKAAKADLSAIRKEYQRKGIKFIAAAIGNDKEVIKSIYKESFLDISDTSKLPQKMAEVIAKQIMK